MLAAVTHKIRAEKNLKQKGYSDYVEREKYREVLQILMSVCATSTYSL